MDIITLSRVLLLVIVFEFVSSINRKKDNCWKNFFKSLTKSRTKVNNKVDKTSPDKNLNEEKVPTKNFDDVNLPVEDLIDKILPIEDLTDTLLHENEEFITLASIIINKNILDQNLGSELSQAILKDSSQRAKFTTAARLMLATVFAHGKITLTPDETKLLKKATSINAGVDEITIVLAKQCTKSNLRMKLAEKYDKRITRGLCSIEALSSALTEITTGYDNLNDTRNIYLIKGDDFSYLGCKFEDKKFTYDNKNRKER